jgi:ATP-binding cassette subfamily B protein/subfamily B ATP-binding cassette protein MsbA
MPFDFSSGDSWSHLKEIVMNNFYWYSSQILETSGASRLLFILAVYLVATTIFRVITMYLSYYYMIPIRTGVVRDLRNQINDKIISLPLAFFTEERKGDIISRISGDVNEIESSIMSSLDMLFKNPIMIIIYVGGMFIISWQLTLFVLDLLPVAGYIMGQIGKKLKRSSLLGQQQWGMLISYVEETLSGLRIIKAFNAEDKSSKRFNEQNDTFR